MFLKMLMKIAINLEIARSWREIEIQTELNSTWHYTQIPWNAFEVRIYSFLLNISVFQYKWKRSKSLTIARIVM
jgi:hypothetical protein